MLRNSTKIWWISLAYQQSLIFNLILFHGISTEGSVIDILAILPKSLVMYFLSHTVIFLGISTQSVVIDVSGTLTKSYIQPYPSPWNPNKKCWDGFPWLSKKNMLTWISLAFQQNPIFNHIHFLGMSTKSVGMDFLGFPTKYVDMAFTGIPTKS